MKQSDHFGAVISKGHLVVSFGPDGGITFYHWAFAFSGVMLVLTGLCLVIYGSWFLYNFQWLKP